MEDFKRLKVLKVNNESLEFENGVKLYSEHIKDVSEHHYLCFYDLTIKDFDGLEFDFSSDNFFKRIEDYGIELVPVKGFSVKVPGYNTNNGYYSANLYLIVTDGKNLNKKYDIIECQV